MIDVCPAITATLTWLPPVLIAAALADALILIGGALIVRKRLATNHTEE